MYKQPHYFKDFLKEDRNISKKPQKFPYRELCRDNIYLVHQQNAGMGDEDLHKKKTKNGLKQKRTFLQEMKRNKILYLMFLPVGIYFLIFAYFPMAGIVVAFKQFNYRDGLFGSPWIGWENFKFFFSSGKAFLVTKNTVLYNLVFLFLYTVFSVLAAVFIAEVNNKVFKKISQSMMFLPYFISWVVVSAFMYNFCNYEYGIVNTVLKFFGREPVSVYSTPSYWYFLLPFLYVWKSIGYGSVLYLAAIMGIDQECYEAAKIDGANVFQRVRYITIPCLRPTIVILVLMGLGRIMRGDFDMFYQLIGKNGVLMNATDIIDTLVFRSLIDLGDWGMASAAGLYQSVLCFIIIVLANWIVKKVEPDYALF